MAENRFKPYMDSLKKTLTDSKSALTQKKVEVPLDTKLDDVPGLIGSIKTGSSVELVVTAPDYEGQTLTATKGEKKLTGVVTEGIVKIPVDEEGVWTVSAEDENSIEIETDMTFEGLLEKATVYGIKIEEAEPEPTERVTYIDKAVGMVPLSINLEDGTCNYGTWSDSWIFDKVRPCMLKSNGTVGYYLDPNNQTLKAEGGQSDISNINYNGNAMVEVKKFYTKFSMDGEDEVIEISNYPKDGFEPIGFIREDGSEADCFYMPMFGGYKDDNGKLRSLSGQTLTKKFSWDSFVAAAEKNGKGHGLCSFAMSQAFGALITIMIKSCDYRGKLGDGKRANLSGGYDKTGALTNKGSFGYDPSNYTVKVLWVEDFITDISNGLNWYESGILSTKEKIYVKMKPPYSGTTTYEYTEVTDFIGSRDTIKKMKCDNKYGRYPVEYNGGYSQYETCQWYTNPGNDVRVSERGSSYGIWGHRFVSLASSDSNTTGASLSYLPPA